DCLKTLKFLCHGIFQTKIGKVALLILAVVHGSVVLIQTYFIAFVLNSHEFMTSSPVYFGIFYVLSSIYMLLARPDLIRNMQKEYTLWKTDSTILFFVVNATLLILVPLATDSQTFFAIKCFEEYFPNHSKILSLIYKSTFVLTGYIVTVPALMFIYYTQHIKYQVIMLLEHVKYLTHYDCDKEWEDLYYNVRYQKEITRRILFCIKRHTGLIISMNNG
ncbi:hypothetical protein BDFB_010061, partial [Asbolus verrucosus]